MAEIDAAHTRSRVPHAGHHFESLACGIAGERRGGVVDAEGERGPLMLERREQGVVAVSDELRVGGQLGRHLLPAGGDRLELAVAVELVAEEVAEHGHPRPQGMRDAGQGGLIDLEHAEVRAGTGQERRCDPGREVRARGVAAQVPLGREHRREHLGRRRLAVRCRDHDRALRQPRGPCARWRPAPCAAAACPAAWCRRRPVAAKVRPPHGPRRLGRKGAHRRTWMVDPRRREPGRRTLTQERSRHSASAVDSRPVTVLHLHSCQGLL